MTTVYNMADASVHALSTAVILDLTVIVITSAAVKIRLLSSEYCNNRMHYQVATHFGQKFKYLSRTFKEPRNLFPNLFNLSHNEGLNTANQ